MMVTEGTNKILAEAIVRYTKERDLLLFSGAIEDDSSDMMIDLVCSEAPTKKEVSLFLTTRGGDPHAAYRMVRCLQGKYEDIRLLIAGRCKSAGTLVAIGADSLAFGRWGELGPLDTQVSKPDELLFYNSGLDVLQALAIVTESGWDSFAEYVVELIGAGLSTRIASEIAGDLAAGFLAPIAAQVDPMRLAEATRAINVATAYGDRIARGNLQPRTLQKLVNDYPAHPFVIDKLEAETLFLVVTDFDQDEQLIADTIQETRGLLRYARRTPLVLDLSKEYQIEEPGGERDDDGKRAKKATGKRRAEDSPKSEESEGEGGGHTPAEVSSQDGHARGGTD